MPALSTTKDTTTATATLGGRTQTTAVIDPDSVQAGGFGRLFGEAFGR